MAKIFFKNILESLFLLASILEVYVTTAEQPCACSPGDFKYERDITRQNPPDITVKGIKCDCSSRDLVSFPSPASLGIILGKIVYLDLSGNNLTNTSEWDL